MSSIDNVVLGREPAENVEAYANPASRRATDQEAYRKEIVDYFERRQARLRIVKTTETPRGQLIDWIPIESQDPGIGIATPPPLAHEEERPSEQPEMNGIPELEYFRCERGPEGTVPILRKKLNALEFTRPLSQYLAKARTPVLQQGAWGLIPPGSGRGTHWHAATREKVVCFGGSGEFSCFAPYVAAADEFSLIQIGLSNHDLPAVQSVEAGWQIYKEITGDFAPHLFVYYTTNGYYRDADNQGGYNMDVDGWIQHDNLIFPGSTFAPHSKIDGEQRKISLKYQLFRGNWWLSCQGRWVGYYPARLFMGNQSLFSTLGDHADQIGFWGEVATRGTADSATDMGSGRFAAEGWRRAAYFHHLRMQIDRGGGMASFTGFDWRSDKKLYDVDLNILADTSWETFAFVGGPGAA